MASTHSLDMTSGPISKRLITFAFPVLVTFLLQQLYTVADKAIVGRFAQNGMQALAAVGAVGPFVALVLNMNSGLSAAVNVRCANLRGSGELELLRKSMHTSIILSGLLGIFLECVGLCSSRAALQLLETPPEIFELSLLYIKIYMVGLPAGVIYNFGAAILRAHGDTKRPMYILLVTGLINVLLNLVFVVILGMSVAGVALATLIAQVLSAVWVLWILFDPKGDYKLLPKQLRLHGESAKVILRLGIPSGVDRMAFSIANMVMQASVNSFQSTAILAGKTVATDIGELISQVQYAFGVACMSFSGQCYGAKKYKRIDRMLLRAIPLCCGILAVLATVITIFPGFIVSIFNSDPAAIAAGKEILLTIIWGYLLYALAQIFYNTSRGMGASLSIMLLNVLGIIVPRLLWIWVFFPMRHQITWLFLCYPISWGASALFQGAYYIHWRRKTRKTL